ncbi:glutathione S-transferase family protein [Cognatishimia sp. F0-27]|uniref:glutathione S-transferase family protein n=1 Tax=Cognatishimia sp. F0-27 TaxID=2816855 RepID=UPI001D0C1D26|nr:glutathione S-transferase family protein [Cognatishimia sp. F0-27]MCC1492901.1 glutathione S-transferase family protein [Cognatishimia sp. F0-27]
MIFHYSKGSGALAVHVLLEEVGCAYTPHEVPIPKAAHQAPDFLAVNPKGRLPALETDRGVLTENPAILSWLARTHAKELAPDDPFAFAQAMALCVYIATTVHIAFAHQQRGTRWSDDPAIIEGMKVKVPQNLADGARYLEDHGILGPYALGDAYSFCDPYVFQACRWIQAGGVSLDAYPKLHTLFETVKARPATQRAMRLHGL